MKSDKVFLHHILDELNFLVQVTKGITRERLTHDQVKKKACERSLEIIGEVANQLSKKFKERHTQVDWRKVSGMRDVLIHDYFGVNWQIVWDVLKERRVPTLRAQVQHFLEEADKGKSEVTEIPQLSFLGPQSLPFLPRSAGFNLRASLCVGTLKRALQKVGEFLAR